MHDDYVSAQETAYYIDPGSRRLLQASDSLVLFKKIFPLDTSVSEFIFGMAVEALLESMWNMNYPPVRECPALSEKLELAHGTWSLPVQAQTCCSPSPPSLLQDPSPLQTIQGCLTPHWEPQAGKMSPRSGTVPGTVQYVCGRQACACGWSTSEYWNSFCSWSHDL